MRAVVIGAGISGLAAAWRLLHRDGIGQVVVLEKSGRAGGVLAGGVLGDASGDGVVPLDVGAEALLARRPEAVELAREVGLGEDLVHPGTTSARLCTHGRLVAVPPDTVMGVPRDPRSLRDLLTEEEFAHAVREPERPAPPLSADTDVASWVGDRFGQAVVDRLVEPLLGGVYAGRAARLSLQATLPAVWPLAVSGGSVVEEFARKQAVRPAPAESATSPSAPPSPVFAGIRGGVHRLALATAQAIEQRGGEIRCGTTARAVERTADGLRVLVGPATNGALGGPSWIEADVVVVAVPAPAAARLLAEVAPPASAGLSQVETASMALVTAVVDAAVPAAAEGASGLLIPSTEGFAIKAATFSSVKWPWLRDDLEPGTEVLRVSLGRAGEQAELQRDDDDLARIALAELGAVLGLRPVAARAVRVDRWGGALPQYAVGHLDLVARVRGAVAEVPGLGIAGSVLDGVGVPACIAAAARAVEQACESAAIRRETMTS